MKPATTTQRLISMPLKRETDVVLCRNRARLVAKGLNFDHNAQIRIATAVSEIARNAFRYAREGTAAFALLTETTGDAFPVQWIEITIQDQGSGITNLDAVLAGTYQSTTGMGAGLRGAKRLLDRVEIDTGPTGTTVVLQQRLPKGRSAGAEALRAIAAELLRAAAADPLDELAEQNRELVLSIEEIAQQRTALADVNEELKETNRGVVALYDELETIHRVGQVVASRLDLDSLLSAITESTTELSHAERGAFYLRLAGEDGLVCRSIIESAEVSAETQPPIQASLLMPGETTEVARYEGLEAQSIAAALKWPETFQGLLVCPVRDSEGGLIGAFVFGHADPRVFTERTERILATVALQASVGIANARLFRNVQSANEAKAQFMAILSHELRTPLNPVFMLLGSFEEHPGFPVELKQDLEMMRRNLELEARLIDDLLDLTRINEGKLPVKFGSVDLQSVLAAAVHTCSPEAAKKNLRMMLLLDASDHIVRGDAARLQQVFWNLIINAIKFSSNHGVITVATANSTVGTIIVRVNDHGRGMDAEALERIFNPFEQENAAIAARFGGLGLGLAISKGIVAAHLGQIRAESRGPNRGSTLIVTLPLMTNAAATAEPSVAPAVATGAEKLRILFVDDHEDTRRLMTRMLTRRGHEVSGASTIAEALQVYGQGEFDLVISDLGLPDGSGHALMRDLQKIRPIKGIALSGFGMEADIATSLEAGFKAHLIKPLDFQLLDRAILEAVGS